MRDCRPTVMLLVITIAMSTLWMSLVPNARASASSPGIGRTTTPPSDSRSLVYGESNAARPALVAGEGSGAGWCRQNGGYPLGAKFDNVFACGPATGVSSPFDSVGFQCVELSARFLWVVYGKSATNVPDGKDFVAVSHQELGTPVGYPGPGSIPRVGDIVSLSGGASTLPYGHTGVVTSVKVDGQGNGAIGLMEENGVSSGSNRITVSHWSESYGSAGGYYYYNHVSWLDLGSGLRAPGGLPARYSVAPLGPFTQGSGINDRGEVTGDVMRTAGAATNLPKPFLYTSARLTMLKMPAGTSAPASSNAINANGSLAITAMAAPNAQQAYAYSGGKRNRWRLLPHPQPQVTAESALGINAWGDIAGWISRTADHLPTLAVDWIHRTSVYVPVTLAAGTGYSSPMAYASDAAGDAIGTEESPSNRLPYPVVWVGGGRPVLLPGRTGVPAPGAATAMFSRTVNGLRTIMAAGWIQVNAKARRAAVWTLKLMPDQQVVVPRPAVLPSTRGYTSSVANGVNGAGVVAGHATAAGGEGHGFVWLLGKGVTDLNTKVRQGSGWVITGARGINAGGQILAQGYQKSSSRSAMLQGLILSPATG